MRAWIAGIVGMAIAVCCALAQQHGLPPGVTNTQDPKDVPPTPDEAVKLFRPNKSFRVSLVAGEPDVAQPISLAFDERGRLWVAECFSYPKWTSQANGHDRILMFEDADGDGRFERRTVFWNKAYNLTSVLPGNGGIWALCAPHLLFIPDRDGDGVPDGEPQIVLDGWSLKASHNIVNGLTWGPDGWLYGRHGIVAESRVGPPGTPDAKRQAINCGIWRYHPKKKTFEVVAHGTTNPWGMDFDDHGEAFFSNCVIGHLWHLVPGARYQRMYGQDYNRYSYELLPASSDHLHWGGGHWTGSRGGKGIHSEAGGGHAHSGGMIYLGDNLPDRYRNHIFLCNLHGNRINCDRLQRHGNGYVVRHAPDFLLSDNPWFRGIAIDYGPDGGVYISDWCDLGECHDNDGVHRSSGRIYKITHRKPAHQGKIDLARLSDDKLVQFQLHKNDWYVRQARRILTERADAGRPMDAVHRALMRIFAEYPDVTRKLRAMWALYTTGGANKEWLVKQLRHADEHVRSWAIRLLCDEGNPGPEIVRYLWVMAAADDSGLVRLHLASALRLLDLDDRFTVGWRLARIEQDAADPWQPLMIWYGIEPAVVSKPAKALQMIVAKSKMPKVRQFASRRLTEAAGKDLVRLEPLLEFLGATEDTAVQRDVLTGMRDGLRGHKNLPTPKGWQTTFPRLAASSDERVPLLAYQLGLLFKDVRAREGLEAILRDASASPSRREAALRSLTEAGIRDLKPMLLELLKDKAMRGHALRALAGFADADIPQHILKLYPSLTAQQKQDALGSLASRPVFALALLQAVESKRVPRTDVSPFTARQMLDLKDAKVADKLARAWGQVRQSSAEKKSLIAKYKALLTAEVLKKADPSHGRAVYQRTCFQCHTLFGEGNKIGPDLTGSNRTDLHYVLENIIDPSAVIGRDYQLTNIVTANGRLIAGIIVEETDRALTLQTANEKLVISRADVEERQVLPISMMPEGQIEQLTFTELRDLVAYLASKEQVPLRVK